VFLNQTISLALGVCMVASVTAAWSAELAQPSPLTRQAAEQFKQGNLQEAVALQEKALTRQPKDWLSHAAMSFYAWQQGNIVHALEEGQAAAALSPNNYVALTNLALIKEGLEDCAAAIPLYEAATKIEPDQWMPFLGIARCQTKLGHPEAALKVMQEMAAANGKNFSWYFELADTYVRLEKPELALAPAAKAMALAANPEQKESATVLSMLVFLQTNQLEKANSLKDQVFGHYLPKSQELYVRTAVMLLPPSNPVEGKALLDAAIKNLACDEDAEAFYRMGKAFEYKLRDAAATATTSSAWLANAKSAYKRANELAERSKYNMAIAAVCDQLGELQEMEIALNRAKELETWGSLAPFLLTELSKKRDLSVDKVVVRIDNLNCSCHISKVVEALTQVEGVAFVYIPSTVQPYEGIMLIDQTKISTADAFAKATEKTKAFYADMVPPVVPQFSARSTTKLSRAAEAIDASQLALYGNITSFYNAFKAVVPFDPLQELAARPQSKPAM
jgi:tetratricopeptide (TPR) repeat protein